MATEIDRVKNLEKFCDSRSPLKVSDLKRMIDGLEDEVRVVVCAYNPFQSWQLPKECWTMTDVCCGDESDEKEMEGYDLPVFCIQC